MPLSSREVITRVMAMLAGYDWRKILDVREEPDGFVRCQIADVRSGSGEIQARYQKRIVFEVGDILQAEHGPSETHRVPVSVIPRTHRERYLRGQEKPSVWKLGNGNLLMIYNNSSSLVLFRFIDWSVLHLFRVSDHGVANNQVRSATAVPAQYPPEGSALHGFRIKSQTAEIMRGHGAAKYVRARIEHRCTHCGGAIPAGEMYRFKKRMVGARSWATIKMHEGCYEYVLSRLNSGIAYDPAAVSDGTFDVARTWQHVTVRGSIVDHINPDGRVNPYPVETRSDGVVLESFTEAYAIVWQAVGHKTCGYHKVYKSREKAKLELEAVKQRDQTRLYTLKTIQVIE